MAEDKAFGGILNLIGDYTADSNDIPASLHDLLGKIVAHTLTGEERYRGWQNGEQYDYIPMVFPKLKKMYDDFSRVVENNNLTQQQYIEAFKNFYKCLVNEHRKNALNFNFRNRIFSITSLSSVLLAGAAGTLSGLYMPKALNIPNAGNVGIAIGISLAILALSITLLPTVIRELSAPTRGSSQESQMIDNYEKYLKSYRSTITDDDGNPVETDSAKALMSMLSQVRASSQYDIIVKAVSPQVNGELLRRRQNGAPLS